MFLLFDTPVITIDDYELEVIHQFMYPWVTTTDNLSLDPEINKRIRKAATTLTSPDIKSVDKPQVDREDEDGCVQCLHPQHPALWQQDMDHICLSGETAQHFSTLEAYDAYLASHGKTR